ncbi:DUF4376 domain-containing protein [Comamonas sp. GB3 AK4-5]|uniref:DUF4376 domain-containing protein n=1 Tax=Comamonas sp. GB3 AK4-5 TaxID=3231487 RepID=UPI00351E1CCC
MSILKIIPTPNGLTAAHRVVKSELFGTTLRLQVHMYPSADKSEDAHLLWQEYPELPLSVLDMQEPTDSLERALVARAGGVFAGGTVVSAAAGDDLENSQARKWTEIKAECDALESGGFDLAGVGRFDSDAESRARIVGAAMAAKIARDAGQAYAIRWTLADNTTVELDADGAIDVGFALLAHTDGIHQRSRVLYAAIQGAETADAVAAIRWDAESVNT